MLELRLERARTTRDIDLRMTGSPTAILANLQAAARRDLGDFVTFEVGPDDDHAEIQNDGMQYDGLRFRAESSSLASSTDSHSASMSPSAIPSSARRKS